MPPDSVVPPSAAPLPVAPLPVVVNRGGGTAKTLGHKLETMIADAFAAAGQPIDLHLVEGGEISKTIERLAGAPVVAVGGGDGTLGNAASLLHGSGSALAILPLGTRNHLAKQLGLPATGPADLPEIAQIIAAGKRRTIDLARAGTRIFVNNASIGIYTRLVRKRDAQAAPKWLATIPATMSVLRRLRDQHFTLTIDGQAQDLRTAMLLIGNNRYSLESGSLGERKALDEGVLSLFAVAEKTVPQLIGFAIRAALGKVDEARDFHVLSDARKLIIARRRHDGITVAFDGEVELMPVPLTVEILPAALEVIVA